MFSLRHIIMKCISLSFSLSLIPTLLVLIYLNSTFASCTCSYCSIILSMHCHSSSSHLCCSISPLMIMHAVSLSCGLCLTILQLHHVSTQTDRMIDVATTTLEAAETEDAIGSTDDSDASQDQELQVTDVALIYLMCTQLSFVQSSLWVSSIMHLHSFTFPTFHRSR